MKKIKYISLLLVILSLPTMWAFRSANNYFEISKNLEIFASVVKEVNNFYVDEIDAAKLTRTGIDAMLKSLDPYTEFYSESEIEDYRFMTTGQYGGIGSTISKRDDYVIIAEPYEGAPAQKNDLRAGDMILEIDGKSVKGKNTEEVSKLLKGSPNTTLKLLLKREGVEQPIEKSVLREEIKLKNVPYYGMIDKNLGYIKFTGFRQEAAEEVKNAVLELKKNSNLTGIVFDLRGNPGGLLDEAVKVVGLFVPKGSMVVNTKGKMEDWNKDYRTSEEPIDLQTPIIVLIDRGSASAAEIVSGSLQDYDRAIAVGANTFGKGLVQTTRPLPYNSQMKITTSKYYIPSGRCVQALDYAHKDEKGKATKLPDSLRRQFQTKGGRYVYDGNGIQPDVLLDRKKYADVVLSLAGKRLFFDYATHFQTKTASIPEDYQFSEADFSDFLSFLKGKEYEYTTQTEEELIELETAAKDEKYHKAIVADLENIRKKLKEDKHEDVLRYKDDIMEILEEEVASRYYFQKGRIRAAFDDDQDINQAMTLLADPVLYSKLLSVN